MRFTLNIIWLLLSGVWLAAGYAIIAALLCCTVILIPFGVQLFKIAGYALWPFGRQLVRTGPAGVSTLGNLLWLPAGLFLALVHVGAAFVCACTIIGIPFAVANLKMVSIALTPFGRSVMSSREISSAVRAARVGA